MEVPKHIKLFLFALVLIAYPKANKAQFFQSSPYGYLPLSISGGGMYFFNGHTVYNQKNPPIKIRFLPFMGENYGFQSILLKRKKYNFYLGLRMQHVYDNILQTFDSDQTDDRKIHQRNFIWDFYAMMFKLPIGLEAKPFNHVLIVVEMEPGYFNEEEVYSSSIFSFNNPPHKLTIVWKNIKKHPFFFNINFGLKWSKPLKYFKFEPYLFYSHGFIPLYKRHLKIDGIINRPYNEMEGTMFQSGSGLMFGVNIQPTNFIEYVRQHFSHRNNHKNFSRFRFYFQLRNLPDKWFILSGEDILNSYSSRNWNYSLGLAYTLYLRPLYRIEFGCEYDPIWFRPDLRDDNNRILFKRIKLGESIYLTGTFQYNVLNNFYVRLNINPGYYWIDKQKIYLEQNQVEFHLDRYEWPGFLLDFGVGLGKDIYFDKGKLSFTLKYNWPLYHTWAGEYIWKKEASFSQGTIWQPNDYIGLEISYSPPLSKKEIN